MELLQVSKKSLKAIDKTIKVKWKQKGKEMCNEENRLERKDKLEEENVVVFDHSDLVKEDLLRNQGSEEIMDDSLKSEEHMVGTVIAKFGKNQNEGEERCLMCKDKIIEGRKQVLEGYMLNKTKITINGA
jgi:hypothetical protein